MPEIFRFKNIRFFFYSQDHEPVHVHVRHAERSVVIVIDTLEVKKNKGFRSGEIKLLKEKVQEQTLLRRCGMNTSQKKKTKKISAEDLDNKNMKVRVNCWVDGEVILELKKRAKKQKTKYQTLLNSALRQAVLGEQEELEKRVKRLESLVLKKA